MHSFSFRLSACLCAAAIVLTSTFSARAGESGDEALRKEMESMRKAQEEMVKTMRAQQEKIDQLEDKVRIARPAAVHAPIPQSTAAAIESRIISDDPNHMRWSEFTVSSKTKIKLYGFLRLDAIYDDSAPNNTQVIGFVRSEDPTAPGTVGALNNHDHFTMHPRLTRIGADFAGPNIPELGCAELSGKLEIDFYNNGLLGQSESRQAVRMRHGYLKLSWPESNLSLLAGQTSDVISPLFPIVNPDLVMWGAGNLGDRRPQVRGEWQPKAGPGKFYLGLEVGLTGADDNQDLDPAGTTGAGYRDGEQSGKPTLQMRTAYKLPVWEKKQTLEFGLWGHYAWERPDNLPLIGTPAAPVGASTDFRSYALGMDLSIPLYKNLLWLKSEAWFGQNLDDIRGGIFQGINTVTGEEIASRGGFIELGAKVPSLKWYSVHAGYSTDDPRNNDLNVNNRSANKTWYLAQRFNFDPLEFGIDYLYWRTDYIGLDKGDTNRFQFFISYKF